MIHFSTISLLDTHINFLKKKLTNKKQSTIFLVGGCVRDLLLDVETNPGDIDFTVAGTPSDIYSSINKDGLSHFITEKFGTITLIKKNKHLKTTKGKKILEEIKYECTPLRTESGYEDFRHPGEIVRSNDLLLDSQRRDFRINAIYYTSFRSDTFNLDHISKGEGKDVCTILDSHGMAFVASKNILIIQDHSIIQALFEHGQFQDAYFAGLLTVLSPAMTIGDLVPTHKNKQSFRIIIDPQRGIQDIQKRKIQCVGNPDKRFQEDALRILRALRFTNVLNHKLQQKKISSTLFDYDKETWNALKRNRELLQQIAKERIKEEMIKVFSKGNPFAFVSLIDEAKLLEFLFPALYATKFVHQPVRYHPFDVYTHTLLTVYELQKHSTNYLVRFGMLYHDVGKVDQFAAYKDELSKEEIRAILAGPHNHRRNGPEFVKRDFSALGFSNKEVDDIAWYVANHHKPEEILDGGNNEKIIKKLRKFLSESGFDRVNDILDITISDRTGQFNPLQNNSDLTDIHYLRKLLKQLHKEEGQFTMKELNINGSDLIKKFSLEPGKLIGELLQQAFDRVLNDIKQRNTKKAILTYLAGYIKNKHSEQESITSTEDVN